jgi:hypothetical protein
MEKRNAKEGTTIKGFARIQVWDNGPDGKPAKLVSDTGRFGPNLKTNIGFLNLLCYTLGGSAGSSRVAFLGVGSGSTPATSGASLPGGEVIARTAPTVSYTGSTRINYIASWASATVACTVGNVGLFGHSSEVSLMAGIGTTTQTWATNQSLAVTYTLDLT